MSEQTAVETPAEQGEVLPAVKPLTDEERTWLAECERIVGEGLGTFRDVGRALQDINEQRLYRETNETFADYLKVHWDMSESQGYRLMDASAIHQLAAGSPFGEIPNEAVAREFAPILHEGGGEAVVKALEDVAARVEEVGHQMSAREIRGVLISKGHLPDTRSSNGNPSKLTLIGALGDRIIQTQKYVNRFAEGPASKGKLGAKPSAKALQYAATCREMADTLEGLADQG